MNQWHVRIDKPDLTFNALHFVIFGHQCEPLHGHDFRLALQWQGALDEAGLLIDFLALYETAKTVLRQYDHRVLLPGHSPKVERVARENRLEVRCGERRWTFPQDDCLVLPVVNTSAELIAQCIGRQIVERLGRPESETAATLQVELEEAPGCWAVCRLSVE